MRPIGFSLLALICLTNTLSAAPASGPLIDTVAGGGPDDLPALQAQLARPGSVAVGPDGSLYISSRYNVYRLDLSGRLRVVAGNGTTADPVGEGAATEQGVASPGDIAVDAAGNVYAIARVNSASVILRIEAGGGLMSVYAGTDGTFDPGDGGPATGAFLASPQGLALDAAGNLYIADVTACRVRRVDQATRRISTVAGTGFPCGTYVEGAPATSVGIQPWDVAFDPAGNLLIAGQTRIHRVDAGTGIITTVAGTGAAIESGDGGPALQAGILAGSIAVNGAGDIFLTSIEPRVRRVDAATGVIDTYAGGSVPGYGGDGGPATSALLNHPRGLAVEMNGTLLIAEDVNGRVRAVDPVTRSIATRAGSGGVGDGGPATRAVMSPFGVAYDAAGNLYVADYQTNRVRRVEAATGIVTSVAGNGSATSSGDGGPATEAGLIPTFLAFDGSGNLFIGDLHNARVRRVDAATGIVTTVAGTGVRGYSPDGIPATQASIESLRGMAVDRLGNLYLGDGLIQLPEPPPDETDKRIRRVDSATGIISTVARVSWGIFGLALDANGNIYVSDTGYLPEWTDWEHFGPQGNFIYRVDAATGFKTVLAGNGVFGDGGDGGPASEASVRFPVGLVMDRDGSLYFSDSGNHRVRKVDAATGVITTVAGDGGDGYSGDGGPAGEARLSGPRDLALDPDGDLAVADSGNNRARLITGRCGKIPGLPVLASNPPVLWPPNHRMVDVTVSARPGCEVSSAVLTGLTSSEPDDAPGGQDGNTTDDMQDAVPGTSDLAFRLRAERSAQGTGRVYTATYEVTDPSSRVSSSSLRIVVPHDRTGVIEPLDITLSESGAGTVLEWTEADGAVSYDVVRGDLGRVHESGDGLHLGPLLCVESRSTDASTSGWEDAGAPAPGEVFFYLVEYRDAWGFSSFGEESAPVPRDQWSGGCR